MQNTENKNNRKEASRTRESRQGYACEESNGSFSWTRGSLMRLTGLAVVVCVVALGGVVMADALDVSRIEYQGAFKLSGAYSYGGHGSAYYPDGNPTPDPGEGPGSLFVLGHTWNNNIGQVAIPTTLGKLSDGATVATLTQARDLVPPTNANPPYAPGHAGGIEYVYGDSHLYFCTHPNGSPSGVQTDLDGKIGGNNVQYSYVAGPPEVESDWYNLSGVDQRSIGDSICSIPSDWSTAAGIPDQFVAMSGTWMPYSRGPRLYAYDGDSPVDHDGNPATHKQAAATKLIEYGGANVMTDWDRDDSWQGVAWLESAGQGAVVFAGTKDITNDGDSSNPDTLHAALLFYDPGDVYAAVTGGNPYDPQPYAMLDVQDLLFKDFRFDSVAYDRERNLLFAIDRKDSNPQVVYVWKIADPPAPKPVAEPASLSLLGLALLGLRKKRS